MINKNKNCELIKFEDGDFTLDVNVIPDEDTVYFLNDNVTTVSTGKFETHTKN